MKITHIEHIGIAVPNLEEAIKYYENVLGLKCYKKEVVEDQKVTTAFFKVGDTKIELLEATLGVSLTVPVPKPSRYSVLTSSTTGNPVPGGLMSES